MKVERVSVAWLVAALTLGVPVASRTALAQQGPVRDPAVEARTLFEQGVQLAAQERWGEALDFFQRSRALVARPNTVFNEASTLLRLGRLIEARAALNDFLQMSDATRDAASRAEADRMIATATASIGTLALAVSPPDAEIRIDGRATSGTGAARALDLDPGAHTLTAALRGYVTATITLSLGQAEHMAREVTLAPHTTTGTLTVNATPEASVVRLDGRVVGRGSFTQAVSPGPHEVEVTAEGYESTHRHVMLGRGDTVVVQAALAPRAGLLGNPTFWIVAGAGAVVIAGGAVGASVLFGPTNYMRGSTGTLLPEPH